MRAGLGTRLDLAGRGRGRARSRSGRRPLSVGGGLHLVGVRAALHHAAHAARGSDVLFLILTLGLTHSLAEILAEELRLSAHSAEMDCVTTVPQR